MNSLNIISMSYFEDFDILFQPMPYHDHANPLPYTDRSKNHITGDKLFKRKKKNINSLYDSIRKTTMSFYSPYIPFTSYNMTTSLQHLSLTEGKLHKKRWYSEIYQHVFFVCVCLLIKTTFLLQSLTHFIHPSNHPWRY